MDYKFSGSVLRSYAGGKTAPETRQGSVSGVYSVLLSAKGSEWAVTGLTKEMTGVSGKKPLATFDLGKAKGGKWTISPPGSPPVFTWNGKPSTPFVMGAPTWPLAWAPIRPPAPLRIGDEVLVDFTLPMHSLLEDDPIGSTNLKVRLIFDGSASGSVPLWRFNIRTDAPISLIVKHPEDPEIALRGTLKLDGEIFVAREDGRVEFSRVIYSIRIRLEGEQYEFGFSSAELIATSDFKRVR